MNILIYISANIKLTNIFWALFYHWTYKMNNSWLQIFNYQKTHEAKMLKQNKDKN